MTALLDLRSVARRFGAVRAVDGVDLAVAHGARHAVIGPNGAGKSTVVSLVSGTLRPSAGSVVFAGRDVTAVPAYRRARLGIVATFQREQLFESLTAAGNVGLAADRSAGRGARPLPVRDHRARDEAGALLARVGLADRSDVVAGALDRGERRRLEVAVALACRPRLLVLDEPTAGMSVGEAAVVVDVLAGLPADVAVLLVEHDLGVVFRLATTVTVLHLGRVLRTGTPAEVRADESVLAAYPGLLGG